MKAATAAPIGRFFRLYLKNDIHLLNLNNIAHVKKVKSQVTFTFITPRLSGTFLMASGGVDSNLYKETYTFETEKEAEDTINQIQAAEAPNLKPAIQN